MILVEIESTNGRTKRVLLNPYRIESIEPMPKGGALISMACGDTWLLSPTGRRTLVHKLGYTTDPFGAPAQQFATADAGEPESERLRRLAGTTPDVPADPRVCLPPQYELGGES